MNGEPRDGRVRRAYKFATSGNVRGRAVARRGAGPVKEPRSGREAVRAAGGKGPVPRRTQAWPPNA
jgi:hypothetical protein